MSREETAPNEGARTPPFIRQDWQPESTPDPLIRQKHGHIGQAISRLDGPLKVKGAARYAAEVPFENLLYAALVTSTVSRGRITDRIAADLALCGGEGPCGCFVTLQQAAIERLHQGRARTVVDRPQAGDDAVRFPVDPRQHLRGAGRPCRGPGGHHRGSSLRTG